jgi:hypothetical protein
MASTNRTGHDTPPAGPEQLKREYGNSSGDRNTRTDEHDWKHFKGGKEHTEHVDAPREPSSDPHRRLDPNP